jgi:integrase
MPKITKRSLDALLPDASGEKRDVWLWDSGDGALKGFGVRMKSSGKAAYVVQYRNFQGRTRRLALGRVGAITPDQARRLASDKLHQVAKGGDPSADRHEARKAMTVAEVCDWYLEKAASGELLGRKGKPIKASTLAMDRSRIEQHVKPLIGRRTVVGLTSRDIERLQTDIAVGKTAKTRPKTGRSGRTSGGPAVASRTLRMLAAIFSHAKVPSNPVRGVTRISDEKRTLALSLDQLTALGKAMREADTEGKSRTGLAVVRALLLTGCRKSEILTATPDQLDIESRCLRFVDTKTGPQFRALGAAAIDHFKKQPQRDGVLWIFPADRGDGHFVGVSGFLADLCRRAKLPPATPHVLRHTFGSVAGGLNYSELTIAGLLGHAARSVTSDYVHFGPDKTLLAAANAVAACIAAALDKESGAEVIMLREARAS